VRPSAESDVRPRCGRASTSAARTRRRDVTVDFNGIYSEETIERFLYTNYGQFAAHA
jgi:hypothetical protein